MDSSCLQRNAGKQIPVVKVKRGSDGYYKAGAALAIGETIHQTETGIQRNLETYILTNNVGY